MNSFDPCDAVENNRETKAADRSLGKLREQNQTNLEGKNNQEEATLGHGAPSQGTLNFERRNTGKWLCSFTLNFERRNGKTVIGG